MGATYFAEINHTVSLLFLTVHTGMYRIGAAHLGVVWFGPANAAEAAVSAEYAWPCGHRSGHLSEIEAPAAAHTIRDVNSPNATCSYPPLTLMTVSHAFLRFSAEFSGILSLLPNAGCLYLFRTFYELCKVAGRI